MFLDTQAVFSPFSSMGGTPDSLAGTNTTLYSATTYDVTGAGSGNAPRVVFGQGATSFGADMGIGDGVAMPSVLIVIGTAVSGGTSVNFALQSAPDNGSNAPGTWTTVTETSAIAVASLTAGTQIPLPFARRQAGAALPRFYRMAYTIVGTTTAGTVSAGVVLGADTSTTLGQYPENFTVA